MMIHQIYLLSQNDREEFQLEMDDIFSKQYK